MDALARALQATLDDASALAQEEATAREEAAQVAVSAVTTRAATVLSACEARDDRLGPVAGWLSSQDLETIPEWPAPRWVGEGGGARSAARARVSRLRAR
ncbi:MAG: hypothetical protein R3A48_15150 [Polyangiales bacterium]